MLFEIVHSLQGLELLHCTAGNFLMFFYLFAQLYVFLKSVIFFTCNFDELILKLQVEFFNLV